MRVQHLMTEPPVVGIHNEVSKGPGFIVEEQTLDVTDPAIARLDVIFHHRIATTQVRIVIVVLAGFALPSLAPLAL